MLALATDALGPTARLATEGKAMRQANSWLVADFMCVCGWMIASADFFVNLRVEFDETA